MKKALSIEGQNFLKDPIMLSALREICSPLQVTPKQFLMRFEEILSRDPMAFFELFEKEFGLYPKSLLTPLR